MCMPCCIIWTRIARCQETMKPFRSERNQMKANDTCFAATAENVRGPSWRWFRHTHTQTMKDVSQQEISQRPWSFTTYTRLPGCSKYSVHLMFTQLSWTSFCVFCFFLCLCYGWCVCCRCGWCESIVIYALRKLSKPIDRKILQLMQLVLCVVSCECSSISAFCWFRSEYLRWHISRNVKRLLALLAHAGSACGPVRVLW